MGASVLLKADIKTSLGGKKSLKTKIFRLLFSSKNAELRSKKWSDCTKVCMGTSCSATYSPKVGARFSLKVGTKGSFGGNKSLKI